MPRRHAATFFDPYEPERRAMNLLVDQVQALIRLHDPSVTGFNIGMNCGEDTGQTVPHAHFHLIPRRRGHVGESGGECVESFSARQAISCYLCASEVSPVVHPRGPAQKHTRR
ncbi:HIT family protein [Methylorubrum extorquens]|uniref:HIT family protein n=1 Tax=Methylorubrum extorquens TaxID=408 RepID=UPI003D8146BC